MLVSHLHIVFGEMSIQVLCLFFKQVIWFLMLLLSRRSSLYIMYINPVSDMNCKYFSHSVSYDTIFNFDKIQFICNFVACTFIAISKKPLPGPRSQEFILVFFYEFIALALSFTSLIHF